MHPCLLAPFLFLAGIAPVATALDPCQALSITFPQRVSYPGSSAYNKTNSEYWDQRSALQPSCIFYPKTASHVSIALRTLVHSTAKFAIKSGGHMATPTFNNIDNGVLISTERMKKMNWVDNGSVLQVSAGALWSEVYSKAAEKGRVVVGGRVGDIGVSGFLLGGGVSHLGAEHGFGCDNIVRMEVVLASGRILTASPLSHPKLFRALKGGSSNFGIVTRFDLSAYPVGSTWGGTQMTLITDDALRDRVLDAVTDFHMKGSSDKKASLIPTLGLVPSQELNLFIGTYFHSNPPSNNGTPAVFRELLALGGITVNVGSYSLLEVVNATGAGVKKARNAFLTGSIIASRESIAKAEEVFRTEFSNIADVEGLGAFITFQPFPKSFIEAGKQNGGNVMGLSPGKAPYSVVSQSVSWSKEEDDGRVQAAQIAAGNSYMSWARQQGLAIDFLYLNDADGFQNVFAGYGEENVKFLRDVRDKYDPTGVYAHLMPGGFKV